MAIPAEVITRAIESIDREQVLRSLRVLTEIPSRAGDEARLAEAVRAWGSETVPDASWVIDQVGPTSANLITTFPGADRRPSEVMLYTHLDTSLSGDPGRDFPLSGVSAEPSPLEVDDNGSVRGFGLAVSKAPGACALTSYVAIATACREIGSRVGPLSLLLSAGGTHRAPSGGFPLRLPDGLDRGLGVGVEVALRRGPRPKAVINVKGGADGVLREEPGCLLVRVEVRDRMAPVPVRDQGAGAAVRAARVAEAIEGWRERYVERRRGRGREIAADLGVGALESGLPYKPDILPAIANVYVYIVTLPEDDPDAVVSELEAHVHESMSGREPDWSPSCLRTEIYGAQPGASTEADSAVVAAARGAWEDAFGRGSAEVRDYTGSTDGVIFRRHGIPTARLGVSARASNSSPTTDCVSLDAMQAMTRVYVDALGRLI